MSDFAAALAAEKAPDATGVVREIKDRNGEPYRTPEGTPCAMTVLGKYAEPVQRAIAHTSARVRRAYRVGEDPMAVAAETAPGEVVAAVAAWTLCIGGVPVPHTPENVAAVLAAAPWIADQVRGAMDAPALFSTGSSSSS